MKSDNVNPVQSIQSTSTWKHGLLGEFITLQRGFDLPSQRRQPGLFPIVSSSGISDHNSMAMVNPPGVVTGRYGTIGEVFFLQEPFWPLNTTLWVKDFKGNDERFVFYLLRTIDFNSCSDKSSVPGVNRNDLHRIRISIPSCITEQRAIARVLGALDDKIELNRRLNRSLEELAQAVFRSWFVDFDPVTAKASGRTPFGLDSPTAALFPTEFQDSEVGEIPSGWLQTNLGEETTLLMGYAFKSKFFTEAPPGVRLARGDNVKEGEFYWDNKARYWPSVTSELERYRLQRGDVLIGMDGSKVGKNWVRVRESDLPCLLVQRVARLRVKNSVGEHFITRLIGNPRFRDYVEGVKTGTSIPHISGGQIENYAFVRPARNDNRLFGRFEEIVDPWIRHADQNHDESRSLAAARDILLPPLLSGELRIKDAEKLLEKSL